MDRYDEADDDVVDVAEVVIIAADGASDICSLVGVCGGATDDVLVVSLLLGLDITCGGKPLNVNMAGAFL